MRIIRRSDQRVVPWKNGRGETLEIAVHPPGSTLEDFDWRVSSATVAEDGPFSAFPGIDRTLVVLDGPGLTLDGVRLDRHAVHRFAGDVPVSARLHGGPVRDLNVMTRRERWSHEVSLRSGPVDAAALIALEPSVVESAGTRTRLAPGDAAFPDGPVDVTGLVAAVRLWRP